MRITPRKELDEARRRQADQAKLDLVAAMESRIKRNPSARSFIVSTADIPPSAVEAVVVVYKEAGWNVQVGHELLTLNA